MQGVYSVVPNSNGRGWDVIRMIPTVVSAELKYVEAAALAFALNDQLRAVEGKQK